MILKNCGLLYTYYGIGLLIVLGSFLWRLGAQHAAPAGSASTELGDAPPPQASAS